MFIKPRYLPILKKYSSLHAVTKEELYESILEFKNDELVSLYIDKTDFQECLLNCLCILADERRIVGKQAARVILVTLSYYADDYYNSDILRDKLIFTLNTIYDTLNMDVELRQEIKTAINNAILYSVK